MGEKNYLELMLNTELAFHPSYSNEERGIYVFQNIWLPHAVEQHGTEKCEIELRTNIGKILEKTKKMYERFQRDASINDRVFMGQIEILEKILKNDYGKIIIFGMKSLGERVEVEINKTL
ncbi:hypothetical protein HZA33_03130 [Candidatus Pacearchaeota archaeon]|nr:hypothetical protein [Candidatus Pacearchaeota archaeon]